MRSRFELLAQQSGLRFTLRRRRGNLTPLQRHRCDGIFNLACFGVHDASDDYCAESYEDRPVPRWCWQLEQIRCDASPNVVFLNQLPQLRIGPWRRALFKKMEDCAMAYGLNRMAWARGLLNNLFRRLNDIVYENRFYDWSDRRAIQRGTQKAAHRATRSMSRMTQYDLHQQ